MVNLIEAIASYYNLEPAAFDQRGYKFVQKTPMHTFTTVVTLFLSDEYCLVLTARDFFDEGLAKRLLDFLKTHEKAIDPSKPSRVFEGFHHEGFAFDTVMVINSECHDTFSTQNEELHARTLQAFPSFRCEFSGDEKPSLIRLIRRDFVTTIDWRRKPAPQVYMRYNDTRTGRGSRGNKLGLTTIQFLQGRLEELTEGARNFVEIENFRGQTCRFEVIDDAFLARVGTSGVAIRISREDLNAWVNMFLIKGTE